jgi:hypothetical protein
MTSVIIILPDGLMDRTNVPTVVGFQQIMPNNDNDPSLSGKNNRLVRRVCVGGETGLRSGLVVDQQRRKRRTAVAGGASGRVVGGR